MSKRKFIETFDPEYLVWLAVLLVLFSFFMINWYGEYFENLPSLYEIDPLLFVLMVGSMFFCMIMMKLIAIENLVRDKKKNENG